MIKKKYIAHRIEFDGKIKTSATITTHDKRTLFFIRQNNPFHLPALFHTPHLLSQNSTNSLTTSILSLSANKNNRTINQI